MTPEIVNLYRKLIGAGGIAYLLWWGSVELLLPGSYNPIGSRLAVVLCFGAVFTASHFSAWVSRHLSTWLLLLLCLLTTHYFYLFHRNNADMNWVIGSYITIIAAGACLQSEVDLLIYSVYALILSSLLPFFSTDFPSTVFFPGVITILAFAYFGLSSRLRLLKRLSLQNSKLEMLGEEMEAFSYSVSHDLRSPLRTITGFSGIILEDHGDQLSAEVKDLFSKVVKGGEKMAELIESLLRMSKITRLEVNRTKVNLSEISEKIAQRLKTEDGSRNVQFKIQKNLWAHGDPTLIEAALGNLIENAWKYTNRKTEATIEIGMRLHEGERIYFIADNGAGFEMRYATRLFGVFQRLHSEEEFSGTGIGLATVKRIVQKHGGKIWAEAELGKGARFYFTL